ncbi:MAG: CoA-binding protein [Proteobacteria bacterium]|nr:CoA-binding protein [Pseudomonadota bacterium]MBU4471656.1 CoA-binding protein [Pseudomonadota bacterium]MCG2751137.1 CoA-binding protein [Desulfobacteraceae bacterium]
MKVDFNKLNRAFNPKVLVVVGDSKASGYQWIRGQMGLQGKLYSVHVNPESREEIKAMGIQSFPSILDVPEPVDLAIVAVSRNAAPTVLEDLIKKDVAAAHFFSAGFSETKTEEGRRLEKLLVEKAEKANFHLIGPNCMGLFNPAVGIKQADTQYDGVSGPVGFISQSGSISISFCFDAHLQGIDINKSISYGNGIVLDSADFLDYFAQDSEIKATAMYIEGVKNGERFFASLKAAAAKKPVIIWKGGRTEEGSRAIASHTGSLASSQTIWETAVRQCGAMNARNMEELVDTTKALLFLSDVKGNRMVIAGGPGGQSVISTDIFAEVGLNVPVFTNESYAELETFFNTVGGSYQNPIDSAGPTRQDMKRVLDIVVRDANIDNIFYMVSSRPGSGFMAGHVSNTLDMLDAIRKSSPKPLITAVFLQTPDAQREVREVMFKLQNLGIPAFPSVQRAATALKNALDYYEGVRRRRVQQ